MSKADKKQRHKAKREAKRLAARRQQSISPVKRLANTRGEVECWMSDGFEKMGQKQIFVYKRAAGLSGIACFLVDRGVVGLKDAWTRLRIERAELDDMIQSSASHGIVMNRCTEGDARRWVAGAARWAHDNGMRLPKDWLKAAAFIGGVGDWASADVSEFEMEFAGHPQDLRQRLIGQPFEDFIQRTDIEFIFSDNAPVMNHRTGEYLDHDDGDFIDDEDLSIEELSTIAKQFTESATALAALTQNWLAEKKQTPSKELVEAWISTLMAGMLSNAALPDATRDEVSRFGVDILEKTAERIEESRSAEYNLAMEQVLQHLGTHPDILKKELLKDRSAGGLVHQPYKE